MIVLGIIGTVVVLFLIFIVFNFINEYTIRKYSYKFYSIAHFIQIIIGNWIIYFGYDMYVKALKNSGDTLNGQLLILIGVVVILFILYKNFKYVSFFNALILSILQLLLSIPLSIGTFLILIIAVAFFSGIKPVYVINNN